MKASFSFNFLKIYFWQIASMLLSAVSFLIVTPFISHDQTIYGVYMTCISVTMFLSYADFGFLNSGFKFASEYFAQHNKKGEMRVLGFLIFTMGLFTLAYSLILLILALHPQLIIKGLQPGAEVRVASQLLLILSVFSSNVIVKRVIGISFGIRLEDYLPQKLFVAQGILAIVSILYFFTGGRYDIVGYFLFNQCTNFLANMCCVVLLKTRYKYSYTELLSYVRFSKPIFNLMKKLALSSLYITLLWVLFFEADVFLVSKFWGAQSVALYSVGVTFASFFRLFTGGFIYSPYTARFNHFIGAGEHLGLKAYFYRTIVLTMPIVVIPTLTSILLMRPFVIDWVGSNFSTSVILGQLMISGFLLSFLALPSSIYLTGKQRVTELNVIATITLLIFSIGIFFFNASLGLVAFALFKCIALLFNCLSYTYFAFKELEINFATLLKKILLPIVPSVVFLIVFLVYTGPLLPQGLSRVNLLFVLALGGIASAISFGLYYFCSKQFKSYTNEILTKLFAHIVIL